MPTYFLTNTLHAWIATQVCSMSGCNPPQRAAQPSCLSVLSVYLTSVQFRRFVLRSVLFAALPIFMRLILWFALERMAEAALNVIMICLQLFKAYLPGLVSTSVPDFTTIS